MLHAQFSEAYIHFTLMYMEDHILPVLPIKDLINKDGEPTTPVKLVIIKKPSISHLRVLFCPCVVKKATAHVRTKALKMRHQAQKCFQCIFIGIAQHQKGNLFNAPHKRKIVSLYNVVFDEGFSSSLSHMSQPYTEVMAMQPVV